MKDLHIADNPLDTMKQQETQALLRQGLLTCKSALDSLSQVFLMITDENLRALVCRYRDLHENCAENCRQMLEKQGVEHEKNTLFQAPSWLSTQVKLAFRSDTPTLAALLFDGCHGMIRDLYAHLHGMRYADEESKRAVRRLIGLAEDFRDELKAFL